MFLYPHFLAPAVFIGKLPVLYFPSGCIGFVKWVNTSLAANCQNAESVVGYADIDGISVGKPLTINAWQSGRVRSGIFVNSAIENVI